MSPPRPRAGGWERAPEMDSAPARVSAAAGIFLAPPGGVHPRISVVIVVSGSHQPLMRCLDALEQCRDRVALEAIVVDHSPDDACAEPDTPDHAPRGAPLRAVPGFAGCASVVRTRFPWVEVVDGAESRGYTFGVNRGFSRARAPAVLMLSPDCRVTSESLERLIRAMACEPELAAAAPALPDRHGIPARSYGRFPGLWALVCDQFGLARAFPDSPLFGRHRYGGRGFETLGYLDWASGAALLIPLALWRKLGGLDENLLVSMEDVDWCRRAAAAGHRVRYVPAARVTHFGRESARSIPEDAYLQHLRSRVYYFRKHHGAATALAARAILSAGLMVRLVAAALLPGARTAEPANGPRPARVYAAGLGVVWAVGR